MSTPTTGVSVGSSTRSGAIAAAARLVPILLFALLPVAAVSTMFIIGLDTGPLALDFRQELYPQAKSIVGGVNPYPEGLWPPLAVLVAVPLTFLPLTSASLVIGIAGLACMAAALRLVGVRDWRVYGVVALWPPVLADIRIAHLTPLLCLLAAAVWRYRDRPHGAGVALGLACGVKFLLWPLGVWLLATGRARAAILAAAFASGSLLLVAPFAPLGDYLRTLLDVSDEFDQDSYSTFGLLTQLGTTDSLAHVVTFIFGGLLVVLAWRCQSYALAIAAALVLSPIVWLDFYALAAIPLAIARPRMSPIWILPLVTLGLPSSGIATDPVWGVGRLLLVFAIVLAFAMRAERELTSSAGRMRARN